MESEAKTEISMPDDACPMPTPKKTGEQDAITQMLAGRRIAVVGMTPDESRAGHYVPEFLRTRGKEIIPVNPTYPEVDGLKSYPTLADVPGHVDVVLVFRRPEFCAQVAEDAAAVHASGLWLQSGIYNDEAKRIAEEAGMNFVQGRCMMVEMR
jgi:predicted CoA-binding protein